MFDLSFAPPKMYGVIEKLRSKLPPTSILLGYGHIGDGNIHINVIDNTQEVHHLLNPFIFDYARE